jgi:hypothetical protein
MVIRRSYSLTLGTSIGIGHNNIYPSEHIIPKFLFGDKTTMQKKVNKSFNPKHTII